VFIVAVILMGMGQLRSPNCKICWPSNDAEMRLNTVFSFKLFHMCLLVDSLTISVLFEIGWRSERVYFWECILLSLHSFVHAFKFFLFVLCASGITTEELHVAGRFE
jgi:hypothetical protein